jgi:hypothetical protein
VNTENVVKQLRALWRTDRGRYAQHPRLRHSDDAEHGYQRDRQGDRNYRRAPGAGEEGRRAQHGRESPHHPRREGERARGEDKDYHLVERSYGSFSRSVELPSGVKVEDISAEIANGVLKVTVQKPAPKQTKQIEIKTAAA